jgi:hypothetical protein
MEFSLVLVFSTRIKEHALLSTVCFKALHSSQMKRIYSALLKNQTLSVCNYHNSGHYQYASSCLLFKKKKKDVSETSFCFRPQVVPTHLGPETGTSYVDWVQLSTFHLKKTESSLRNVVF